MRGNGQAGYDLTAMVVQMGRDHGLPSYTVYRSQCGLRKPESFEDLQDLGLLSDIRIVPLLKELYKYVLGIVLF